MSTPQPIIIEEYSAEWVRVFEEERASLQELLGSGVAIEHIGSTSVEGLSAKPIVDILIGVRSLADAPQMIPKIESLGYKYIQEYEKDLPQRRYFNKLKKNGEHTHHIHLVERMGTFWRNHLYFRDRLRADASLRAEYTSLKKDLSERYRIDREAYTDAKTSFILAVVNEKIKARERIAALVSDSLARNDRTGWFEELYNSANGDITQIPWADTEANAYLVDWLERNDISGKEKQAIVIGCGLGDDAEELASQGFEVIAFDVSPSAILWADKRFSNSNVRYVAADLFDLPSDWKQAFDLVYECYTVQALPRDVRTEAIRSVCDLVAPGGQLLVVARGWQATESEDGPPWALTEDEMKLFEKELKNVSYEEFWEEEENRKRLRCLYKRD